MQVNDNVQHVESIDCNIISENGIDVDIDNGYFSQSVLAFVLLIFVKVLLTTVLDSMV